jgi:hypothetical protein
MKRFDNENRGEEEDDERDYGKAVDVSHSLESGYVGVCE